jgi:hypothetical protein
VGAPAVTTEPAEVEVFYREGAEILALRLPGGAEYHLSPSDFPTGGPRLSRRYRWTKANGQVQWMPPSDVAVLEHAMALPPGTPGSLADGEFIVGREAAEAHLEAFVAAMREAAAPYLDEGLVLGDETAFPLTDAPL